jgi:hypothetical protein
MRTLSPSSSSAGRLAALITGGLIVSDAPEHLTMGVVQVLGPHRGLTLDIWLLELQP